MPVPLSWGFLNQVSSTTRASRASVTAYRNWTKQGWFRGTDGVVPRKGSNPEHRFSQTAYWTPKKPQPRRPERREEPLPVEATSNFPWIGDTNATHPANVLRRLARGMWGQQCATEQFGKRASGLCGCRDRPGKQRFRSVCLRSLLLPVGSAERPRQPIVRDQ